MKPPVFTDVVVVGMHFRERDGVPAKSIVANFVPPVELTLEREPDNQFDSFAVKVRYGGHHIGYIEATSACFLAPWMDQGHHYSCVVDEMIERKQNLHPVVRLEPQDGIDSNVGEPDESFT